jgi:hypothetical protein
VLKAFGHVRRRGLSRSWQGWREAYEDQRASVGSLGAAVGHMRQRAQSRTWHTWLHGHAERTERLREMRRALSFALHGQLARALSEWRAALTRRGERATLRRQLRLGVVLLFVIGSMPIVTWLLVMCLRPSAPPPPPPPPPSLPMFVSVALLPILPPHASAIVRVRTSMIGLLLLGVLVGALLGVAVGARALLSGECRQHVVARALVGDGAPSADVRIAAADLPDGHVDVRIDDPRTADARTTDARSPPQRGGGQRKAGARTPLYAVSASCSPPSCGGSRPSSSRSGGVPTPPPSRRQVRRWMY